ncbi:diacylglycerol kinase [Sporomusa aerivorans]|uniref:diacylglycerol kinase n=1 Tax=Sporomusa aerivorans TaxID=204936 RepID=UPI00352A536A
MRVFSAFQYAVAGIIYCFRKELNLKIHALAAVLALSLAWQLELSKVELAVVLICIAGVIAAEIVNTAIEAIVDKVSPEFHPLARAAKDAAAGAVLVTAFTSLLIGYLLFWDKLFK